MGNEIGSASENCDIVVVGEFGEKANMWLVSEAFIHVLVWRQIFHYSS